LILQNGSVLICWESPININKTSSKKGFYIATVKLVYNDHPRDPKLVAAVDRWLLFRGSFML
jgi:hypothetical protein